MEEASYEDHQHFPQASKDKQVEFTSEVDNEEAVNISDDSIEVIYHFIFVCICIVSDIYFLWYPMFQHLS